MFKRIKKVLVRFFSKTPKNDYERIVFSAVRDTFTIYGKALPA